MPDMFGNWDRRSDDPDYVKNDSNGNPIYKRNGREISGTEREDIRRLERKLGETGWDIGVMNSDGYDITGDGSVVAIDNGEKIASVGVESGILTVSIDYRPLTDVEAFEAKVMFKNYLGKSHREVLTRVDELPSKSNLNKVSQVLDNLLG